MFQPNEPGGVQNILIGWVIVFLTTMCILECRAHGEELRLLDTEELALEYSKLNPGNRDPYAPQYTGRWRERAALLWDSNLIRYGQYKLLWNHRIHTETIDSGAVKTVGWEWWAGISLFGRVDILHHHHSRHILDESSSGPNTYGGEKRNNRFPVEDALVVRVRFISKEYK